MENIEKQITEEPKNPRQVQNIEPVGKNLSGAELEKAAGGAAYSTSRSNIRGNR